MSALRSLGLTGPPPAADASPMRTDAPSDLVRQAHLERLRACLDPRLDLDTLRRLQACGRLRTRLATLLAHRYRPIAAPSAPSAAAGAGAAAAALGAALARAEALEAARIAGAIWHARSLRLVVSGPMVASLVAGIGRRAHACGLRRLAGAVATAPITDPARLVHAIERDGVLCLKAAAAPSPDLSLRLLVSLPPGTAADTVQVDQDHVAHAATVLAHVAAALQEPSGDS